MNKLPNLCAKEKCTACAACHNACAKGAIMMKEDEHGELFPVVDATLCIGCGKCEKVCPELNEERVTRNAQPEVYCCWLKDSELRKKSTSGGAAYAISSAIIALGGHVWGAAYDDDMYVRYVEANTLDEMAVIQKSKYVQSAVGGAFRKIKAELDGGDYVLFCGTGCHVKGLLSFLGKDYPRLFTMDLVCHGVPGQGVFQKYRRWVEHRHGDVMATYIPRPKRESDGQEIGYYSLAKFRNIGEVKLTGIDNSYFVGFQHNLFLRSACHDCKANGECRYSDFTVADFWGLGKVAPFKHYQERTLGISMLALNSEKARHLFNEFKDDIVYELRSYKEASFSNTQYFKSAVPSPQRENFRSDFPTMTWDELSMRYMQTSMKEKVLWGIKRFAPPICYYMLNYWRNG